MSNNTAKCRLRLPCCSSAPTRPIAEVLGTARKFCEVQGRKVVFPADLCRTKPPEIHLYDQSTCVIPVFCHGCNRITFFLLEGSDWVPVKRTGWWDQVQFCWLSDQPEQKRLDNLSAIHLLDDTGGTRFEHFALFVDFVPADTMLFSYQATHMARIIEVYLTGTSLQLLDALQLYNSQTVLVMMPQFTEVTRKMATAAHERDLLRELLIGTRQDLLDSKQTVGSKQIGDIRRKIETTLRTIGIATFPDPSHSRF